MQRKPDQDVIREWARKRYLRRTMRTDDFSPHEIKTLDDRLAQWTQDRQRDGSLPASSYLNGQYAALAKQFKQMRPEEGRPILTADEQQDIDLSRSATVIREKIEAGGNYIEATKKACASYALSAGVGELDARKKVSDRFHDIYARSISDYAQQTRDAAARPERRQDGIFPPEWGWQKYEPAFRRLVAYDADLYVAERDGQLNSREIGAQRKHRQRWVVDQQGKDLMPSIAELRSKPFHSYQLPAQKDSTREEKARQRGPTGPYWNRLSVVAADLKRDIDGGGWRSTTLDDYALHYAGDFSKTVDQCKRDIEIRFSRHYLYTPAEYADAEKERHSERPRTVRRRDEGRDDDRER